MKELLKLAEEKGWKAKTLSTIWTVDCLLGRRKATFLNEWCESNILNEIQKWLRDTYNIHVEPAYHNDGTYFYLGCEVIEGKIVDFQISDPMADTFEEAQRNGLIRGLKLVK